MHHALFFHGETLHLLPSGALYWPARATLAVSDLHLGKSERLARRGGALLPPYETQATLEKLDRDLDHTGAETVICLGDSFDDLAAADGIEEASRLWLIRLMAGRDWTWITGNHDPVIADRCGGELAQEAVVDGLVLRHEADPREDAPELSGHFHPKLRVRVRGRQVARRCFVATETKLVLPAFGSLTGGLDAQHPEIRRAVGMRATALVPVEDRMLRFPLAA